ncbi:unnamed protein product [Ophioblennius macclurei]
MASLQKVRPSQANQLAPTQVVTEQQSLVVIKKLLAIAVSGITYLRGVFPGRAYGKKYVEDQKVMILREDPSCPGAVQILHWMQGCFDAIHKKYLRKVVMSISADVDNPQIVTEFYQFRIQYNSGEALMDFESNNSNKVSMSCGNTKKASILLVRKLYTLMQNLGPLPDSVSLNMKLAYYDEVTPADYQPPGFREADSGMMEFETEPLRMAMGEVVTPFHSLKLDMTTERRRVDQVDNGVTATAAADKWVFDMEVEEDEDEEEEEFTQSRAPDAVEQPDSRRRRRLDKAEIQDGQMRSNTETEKQEVKSAAKTSCGVEEAGVRTRSGRVFKPIVGPNRTVKNNKQTKDMENTVSAFHIPNSQEAPVTKKRKLSEPKKPEV